MVLFFLRLVFEHSSCHSFIVKSGNRFCDLRHPDLDLVDPDCPAGGAMDKSPTPLREEPRFELGKVRVRSTVRPLLENLLSVVIAEEGIHLIMSIVPVPCWHS